MTTSFPIAWRAHWISPPEDEEDLVFGAIQPPRPRHPFERVRFGRDVVLKTQPAKAPLRVTADSRYVLRVNGMVVGRGPIRSQSDRLHYDTYDVARFLQPGENTLELDVTYYGTPTPFWAPARAGSGLGHEAIAALEVDLGAAGWVVTDDTWWTQRLDEWRVVDVPDARLPLECFDATVSRSTLRPARMVAVRHMGGLARSQPPSMPYGRLLPRSIGTLGGECRRPASASVTGGLRAVETTELAPLRRIGEIVAGSSDLHQGVYEDGQRLDVTAEEPGLVTVDMGSIVAGRIRYTIETDAPVTVRVALMEKAYRFAEDPLDSHIAGNMLITAAAPVSFEADEVCGFRYAMLLIEGAGQASVSVRNFLVEEVIYELRGDHGFGCDDKELEVLYRAGRRTVEVNSHDAFVDCPTREQRAWVGDFHVHALVHLTCSDDWRLVRRSLELCDSPRSDGLLPMAAAGDLEFINNVTIPDWSLYWVHALYDYFNYSAELDFVVERLPTARGVLAWFLRYLDPEVGLVGFLPEWVLTDWSAVFLDGYSSVLNGLLGRALAEYADMSDIAGNAADAAWARRAHARLRAGFEALWDDSRGVYLDHIGGRNGAEAVSQMGQAAALVAGFVPSSRQSRLVEVLDDDATTVYRNWIGEAGSYSPARRKQHLLGIQQIDWNVRDQIIRAEPFGQALVHAAFIELGAGRELVRSIREWADLLWDGNDTFGECWGFGTPCHGWSAAPTSSLIRGVLGLRPGSPGYATAVIAPRYDLLSGLTGSVPTPHGPLTLSCGPDTLRIDTPVPAVLFHPDGTEEALAPGQHELPYSAARSVLGGAC